MQNLENPGGNAREWLSGYSFVKALLTKAQPACRLGFLLPPPLANPSPNLRRPLILGSILLGILAFAYVVTGTINLAFLGDPFDLRHRWVDQQYIFLRQNPFDVYFRAKTIDRGQPPPKISRNAAVDPSIGTPTTEGYPPWSFFSGAIFVPLPWKAERIYYAALNLAAIAFLAWWGYSLGRRFSLEAAIFLAAAAVAIGSARVTLKIGQYGILINALLAATLILEDRGQSFLSGIILGIAALKPNIAAPFMLCFLIQRRFKTLAVAIAYLIAASLVIWAVTHTNPFEMTRQMLLASQDFVTTSASVLKAVIRIGVPINAAIILTAACGIAIGAALMFLLRDATLLCQFSIACVIAKFWSYHLPYDDLMMLFLLMQLALIALARPSRWNLIAFCAVELSLIWLPGGYAGYRWPITAAQHLAWLFGLIIALRDGLTQRIPRAKSLEPCAPPGLSA
jgi:hypothetical protein